MSLAYWLSLKLAVCRDCQSGYLMTAVFSFDVYGA
jgi:hypothetical protein